MSFEDALNAFEDPKEFEARVKKSTPGEADEILREVHLAEDRGLSLSPYKRAVLFHHYGENILDDPGDISSHYHNGEPVPPDRKSVEEDETEYPTDK